MLISIFIHETFFSYIFSAVFSF